MKHWTKIALLTGLMVILTLSFSNCTEGVFRAASSLHKSDLAPSIVLASLDKECLESCIKLEVNPAYPNFSNWNQYIENKEASYGYSMNQSDGSACEGTAKGYDKCIHAGQIRKLEVPGFTNCSGLSVRDELGVFEWKCMVDSGGQVLFYTNELVKYKGLSDLIEASQWRKNNVYLYQDQKEVLIGVSDSRVWDWSNPILPLEANGGGSSALTLDVSQAIYYFQNSHKSNGVILLADGISIVGLAGAKMSWGGSETTNCWLRHAFTADADMSPLDTSDDRLERCLILIGNAKYSWIEGQFNGGVIGHRADRLILIGGARSSFNRIHKVSVSSGVESSIALTGGHSNHLSEITSVYSDSRGIYLEFTSHNLIREVLVHDNIFDGLYLSQDANFNHISQVKSYRNLHGIDLRSNRGNKFEDIYIANNVELGLGLRDVSQSTFSRLHIGGTHQRKGQRYDRDRETVLDEDAANLGLGIRILGHSTDNVFTQILLHSNYSGVQLHTLPNRNVFSHITVVNHSEAGIIFYGGKGNIINQALMLNNSRAFSISERGVAGGPGIIIPENHRLMNMMLAKHSWVAFRIYQGLNLSLEGKLWLSENKGDCRVSDTQLEVGILEGSCRSEVVRDLAFENALKGPQQQDALNAHGFDFRYDFPLRDYVNFENPYRGWGKGPDGSESSFSYATRGPCGSGDVCSIWDFRLAANDATVKNINGEFNPGLPCPESVNSENESGVKGDVVDGVRESAGKWINDGLLVNFYEGINAVEANADLTDAAGNGNGVCEANELCSNQFLTNALEQLGDGVGDDDGLCESNENCIYSPNIGGYQGEGQLTGASCVFQDGIIKNVRMVGYEKN